MSAEIPEEKLAGIKQALFSGRKIEAIKLYRKCTNAGLAEAKDAVDKLESELRGASPEKFQATPSGKGCFGIVMVFTIALLLVLWLATR
jgi:ribosomal L7/L12-like protein